MLFCGGGEGLGTENKIYKLFGLLIVGLALNLGYSNCSGQSSEDSGSTDSASSGSSCGEKLSDSIRSPSSIDQAVVLINALPKPLSADCFVRALKRPLKVFATNSPASVQPAYDGDNPRIFIINKNFVMAFVPKGGSKSLMEMSMKVSPTGSIKAELQFPIVNDLNVDSPYSRIREGAYGTSCRTCHTNEGMYAGAASSQVFQSNFIVPLDSSRVSQAYMKAQAMYCNSNIDKYRCQMLQSIFIDGQAQDSTFPY